MIKSGRWAIPAAGGRCHIQNVRCPKMDMSMAMDRIGERGDFNRVLPAARHPAIINATFIGGSYDKAALFFGAATEHLQCFGHAGWIDMLDDFSQVDHIILP